MGHPNFQHAFASFGLEVFDALKKLGVIAGTDFGIAEFTLGTAFDLAAELLRHGLHAVADPEDGNARFKNGLARLVVAFLIGAHVGARENDAFRGEFTNEISRDVVRMNFAVDVGFAHASGDQLGHLAAEVQNQDAVVRHGLECFFCGGD